MLLPSKQSINQSIDLLNNEALTNPQKNHHHSHSSTFKAQKSIVTVNMELVSEYGDDVRRNEDVTEEDAEKEGAEDGDDPDPEELEQNEIGEELPPGGNADTTEDEQMEEEPQMANDPSGLPPKPDGFVEPKTTIEDSKIQVVFPTPTPMTTTMTMVPTPKASPIPPTVREFYPPSDATITDLAHQEIGNLMNGGPKASTTQTQDGATTTTTTTPETTESATSDTESGVDTLDDGGDDLEPSEMEIEVPETKEEEEEINAEIEEWEEDHGKVKPSSGEDSPEEEDNDVADIPTDGEGNGVSDESKPLPQDNNDNNNKIEEEDNTAPLDTETQTITKETTTTPVPIDPLVVSPSWTPPKVDKKNQLGSMPPTIAPIPSANERPTMSMDMMDMDMDMTPKKCHEYDPQSLSNLLCQYNIPPMAASFGIPVVLLLILAGCCWKCCCGGSKTKENSRGEYRAIANTYGDPSYDNAFSEDFSDDEDDDLEDASWGKNSNGRTTLEMKNMGRRKGDTSLSLEEMNG